MMKIRNIINVLEDLAPVSFQEDYDNSGLLVGDAEEEIKGVMLSLDCTEAVLEECMDKGCNLLISHHPIIFKQLKSLTGKNEVERTILKAIKNNIALYAIHTNLDNVYEGVNNMIAEKMGLKNLRILRPAKNKLVKLVVFVPEKDVETVRNAMFTAGAGRVGKYSECSFNFPGKGTFKPDADANPAIGNSGEREIVDEVRVEVIFYEHQKAKIIAEMKAAHPYEEVAYDLFHLENPDEWSGAGMVGELEKPLEEKQFLLSLKEIFKTTCIRHTQFLNKPIKKVALCGGAGSFLLQDAMKTGADIFVTGDFKYHEFFNADEKILIADIGHYESEQYTPELIARILKRKFSTFAVHLSGVNTNPVKYI